MAAWRILAGVAALAGYAWLSHWLMVHMPAGPWTVMLLFGPLLLAIAFTGWQRRHLPTVAAAAALAVGVAWVVARGGVQDVSRLYVLQHAAIHAVLGWTFAFTLRPGATPLISLMAQTVHEHFTPALAAYTRWLTGVWALYFAAMIAVSLAIYAFAPWPWWSFYCNLLTPLAAVALFVGEHVIRYRRHPDFERITLAGALRAWQARVAAQSAR